MVLINADIGQVVRDTSVDQLQSEADRLSSPLNVVKVGEIRQRAQAALDSGNEAAAILILEALRPYQMTVQYLPAEVQRQVRITEERFRHLYN